MPSEFIKINGSFYKRDESGTFAPVIERDILSDLKAGNLAYKGEPNSRALTFADEPAGTSLPSRNDEQAGGGMGEAPASSTIGDVGNLDVNKVFRETLLRSVTGNPQLKQLNARKDDIRTKQLLAPADLTGVTPDGAIAAMRNKGAEYDDAIKSIDAEIGVQEDASSEELRKLQILKDLKDEEDADDELLSVAEARDLGVPYGTTKKQAYGETSKTWDYKTEAQVDKIRSEYNTSPVTKQFNEVQNKYLTTKNILSRKTGPGDLAAIFDFMKALDPTSVVRESEYATAQASGNWFVGQFAKFNALFKPDGGKLPDSVRNEFSAIINEKYNGIRKQYKNLYDESARLIEKKTGEEDGSSYLINYDQATAADKKTVNGVEYEKVDGGWRKVSSASTPKSIPVTVNDVDAVAEAIGTIESSKRYDAIGPTVKSGMYAGDNAYGKYQIMGKNIPSWSKAALGRSITVQEFLKNPALQEKIAKHQMKNLINQYGDGLDVASAWFSGKPFKGNNAKDVTGTSVPEYINRFAKAFNSQA